MNECPDGSTLRNFALGSLRTGEFERVAGHVQQCAACEESLSRLEQQSDSLVDALATLSFEPASSHDAEAFAPLNRRIVDSIDQLSSRELTLDAGRRLSLQLQEGECRIDRFTLLEEIGIGAFGHVFRAWDTVLDRTVALKVQRGGDISADGEAERFLREARNASELNHPQIVTLHETGKTQDGVYFIVSEFVPGETLAERISRDSFSHQAAAVMIAELADAADYAHERGVVHRDIKPSNIIVDADERPHITDFGLAKRESSDETATSDGQILGTPAYMSPEQARGDSHAADRSSDIYSLGVILYELLTGQRPFQGAKRMLLLQVLEDEPRPPRRLEAKIPRDLETICLKAMAKSPARRYRTARELADDLRAFLAGDPIRARPINAGERLLKWCRKYPLAAAIFLGVTLGSILGFAYLKHLNTWFVQEMALDTARQYTDALEEFNSTYSDVRSQFFHGEDHGSVPPPLPATLQIEVAERISRREDGMQVRIFSPHSMRLELRPQDEFENETVEAFRARLASGVLANERLERFEFVSIEGRDHLKFARGQLMKQSCIDCHNTHKSSPKRDWAEGDLAGVLTLTRPLDRDIDRTNSGFRGASALMIAVAALMTLCGLVLARRRRTRREQRDWRLE